MDACRRRPESLPHSWIEEVVARGVAWLVAFSCRHAWSVTLLMLAATAGILVYAGQNLGIHGDTESLFSPDLPFKQREHRYLEVFPAQNDNLFIVVDAATPERAGEAAAALAARMAAMPERFHDVYLPGGGEFFERHAFLYLKTEELETLADQLAEVQPYVAELARDGSLRGLASMTARGVRAVREGDVGGERLASIFDRMDEAVRARLEDRHYELSWAEVLASADFPGDPRRRFLLAQPVLDRNDFLPGKRAILEVRRVAEELGLEPENGVSVRITGDVALSYEEMEVVRGQAASSAIGSIVLVALLLVHSLRSVRLFLATLLLLLVGLVWTAGFAAVAVGHLNLISSSFAVLFIGLGVDFGIHLCLRYNELLSQTRSHTRALRGAAYDVGTSIVLGGATTAIGFLAFIGTGFVGVAELGVISAGGLVVSVLLTFTLLPALMSLKPRRADGVDRSEAGWSGATAIGAADPPSALRAHRRAGAGSRLHPAAADGPLRQQPAQRPGSVERVRAHLQRPAREGRDVSLDAGRSGAGSRHARKRSRSACAPSTWSTAWSRSPTTSRRIRTRSSTSSATSGSSWRRCPAPAAFRRRPPRRSRSTS